MDHVGATYLLVSATTTAGVLCRAHSPYLKTRDARASEQGWLLTTHKPEPKPGLRAVQHMQVGCLQVAGEDGWAHI
jgi:hypothetical protein